MKPKLLLLFILLMGSHFIYAQMPTTYNSLGGTTTQNNPFNSGLVKGQWILEPSTFSISRSGLITAIYLRASSANTTFSIGCNVALGYSALASYGPSGSQGNSYFTGLTTVYSNSSATVVTNANGWFKLNLQTPFYYDSTKNMVLELVTTKYSTGLLLAGNTITPAHHNPGNTGVPYGTFTDNFVLDFGFDLQNFKRPKNEIALTLNSQPLVQPCQGNTFTLNLKLTNKGANQVNTVNIGWTADGVPQQTLIYNSLVDTAYGTGQNSVTLTSFNSVSYRNTPRIIKAYIWLPGNTDTMNADDTVTAIMPAYMPTVAITPNGYTSICPGGTVNISLAPTTGGTLYTWRYNSSVAMISSSSNPFTATAFGVYSVQALINGCTSSASVIVDSFKMPKPRLKPLASAIVCTGDSLTLKIDSVIYGTSYQWKFSGVQISGATDTFYHARSGGSFTVVASKFGCADSSDSVSITEKPVPTPTITDVNHYLLADTGMVGYQWYILTDTTPAALAGDTARVCMPKKVGNYIVMTYNGGCWGTSHPYYVDSMALGIYERYQAEHIKIYPNPAKNQLYVDAPNNASISVAGMDGRLLMQQPVSNTAIDISRLSEGVYIIRVMDKNNMILKTEKLIKQGQ